MGLPLAAGGDLESRILAGVESLAAIQASGVAKRGDGALDVHLFNNLRREFGGEAVAAAGVRTLHDLPALVADALEAVPA